MKKVIIIGGGAAGFFTAINAKEMNPELDITILEKGKEVLQKVKISGGGRCNVTHACFEPKELVQFYPRGEKELLGPFHQFMTGDTFEWFENNGIPLKIEKDNRVFPESNSSQTIIDCFLNKTKRLGISVLELLKTGLSSILKPLKRPHSPIPKLPSFSRCKNQVSLVFKIPLEVPLGTLKCNIYLW